MYVMIAFINALDTLLISLATKFVFISHCIFMLFIYNLPVMVNKDFQFSENDNSAKDWLCMMSLGACLNADQ